VADLESLFVEDTMFSVADEAFRSKSVEHKSGKILAINSGASLPARKIAKPSSGACPTIGQRPFCFLR